MHHFQYQEENLFAEGVALSRIAEEVGTPSFVYSRATIERHFKVFDKALAGLDHHICYSVKANGSLAVLHLLAKMGGGADVVSGGELFLALEAGIPAGKICFAGVGKTEKEMVQALEAGILMFNVESLPELEKLNRVAAGLGKRARIAIRVNPDVNPETHPYISTGMKENKFGLEVDQALEAYTRAKDMEGLEIVGVDCHIGSQLTKIEPFVEAVQRLRLLLERLRDIGISIKYLDLGGGLGITYKDEEPPLPEEYVATLARELKDWNLTLIVEPGRVVVGNAGILLTRVLYVKDTPHKRFVIVDTAMNDLLRPGLYGAYHEIVPVVQSGPPVSKADVVGPICESTDWLAKDRDMPQVAPGDLLAIMSAGAYGHAMSSNYNARVRPAEVMVSGDGFAVVRDRETYLDLTKGQRIPEFLREGA